MLLVFQGVLERKDAAPGVSEKVKVVAIQVQRLADLLHLLDEPGEFPEVGVIGLVAIRRPELVVVVALDAGVWQEAVERLEVLVRAAWTAVQEQEPLRRVVADSLRPDAKRPF